MYDFLSAKMYLYSLPLSLFVFLSLTLSADVLCAPMHAQSATSWKTKRSDNFVYSRSAGFLIYVLAIFSTTHYTRHDCVVVSLRHLFERLT
jgi:hypothetical protein